jgi:molecular chaperone GrpE
MPDSPSDPTENSPPDNERGAEAEAERVPTSSRRGSAVGATGSIGGREEGEVLDSANEPQGELDPLAQARAEAAKLKEMWMRTAADFDNFRKRTRREIEDAKKSGREDLLRTVLPVFDNVERAVQSAQRAVDVKAVADGLSMVLRQFVDALGRAGIQKIPTVGTAFDPSVHEAIQQVETSEHAPGTVIAEVQPGYVQDERLIRAAMVVVAKAKSADAVDAQADAKDAKEN